MSGKIEFGNTPGAEPPEDVESPSGATPAVAFGLEYRYRFLSIAYSAGGPKIETESHTYTLGDNSTVIAIVINL